MKKLLVLILSLIFMPVAYPYNAANIKINVSGAINNNRYFLCLPNVGCLSILAAKKGKVFPVLHPIKMNGIYVMDTAQQFRVMPQGLPASCNVTVNTSQTITISGRIVSGPNQKTNLSQLRCSVS